MAFVILRNEAKAKWHNLVHAFETELKKHAKARLPGFACPEWVEVVSDLPVGVFLSFFECVVWLCGCVLTLECGGDRKRRRGRSKRLY